MNNKKQSCKAILQELEALTEKFGFAYVANKILERDTQSLKRWLKEKHIPEYKINVIKEFLRR